MLGVIKRMSLTREIEKTKNKMIFSSYSLSIGEIVNLYESSELNVRAEFSHKYPWNDYKKTKFIESILLDIPTPPIYIVASESGLWRVIDGQQRLLTILQFMQKLKHEDEKLSKPLVLQETRLLPSLKAVSWDNDELFPVEKKMEFKRKKILFHIIKASTKDIEYDIYRRLNFV